MENWHAAILAVLQGLTEFLPISSSGHLVLIPVLFGWPDQGLPFDVAVHVGSMVATIIYFRRDFARLFMDAGDGAPAAVRHRLAGLLLVATIPAGIAALAFGTVIEGKLRDPVNVALALILFGLLMWWADRRSRRLHDYHVLGWRGALLLGCAQALALIPGTSRSGITITAGLLLGLTREAAARFSFLMAVPVIALAGAWEFLQLIRQPQAPDYGALAIGFTVSALTAYACIHWFLRYLRRYSLTPFVIYRLALGGLLLWMFASP